MRSSRGRSVLNSTPSGRVHYWLPVAGGGNWHFDVPADLANCIGRYARIPEFVAHSHLLARTTISTDAGN